MVHVAHANGFPPGTYRPLTATLTERYHVIGMPARPLWPGSQPESAPTWRPLVEDLIRGLDELGLAGIAGVGHSLGSVLTLWAAIYRPDLFRALVLIDPVILPPSWLRKLRLLRRFGLGKRQPMVQGALRRRRTWPSRQDCYEHYRTKALFVRWPEDSLRAYVQAGTRERPGGSVELTYPPEWEAHIFATTPTGIWRDLPKLRTPALVVRGEQSDTFVAPAQRRVARLLPRAEFVTIPGAGHLAPMERPLETALAVRDFLDRQVL